MTNQGISNELFREALCPLNEQRLANLIRVTRPLVFHSLRGLGAPPDLCEDFFFIGFEVLWQAARIYEHSPDFMFYPYLLQTCKQQWYNESRRRKYWSSGVTPEELGLFTPDSSIQELLELVEFNETLHRYLEKLKEPCLTLLLLWADGLSYEEIAKTMGYKDADSARQQRFKCMTRLRKMFE